MLSTSKVLAGGLAAATSAILGSYFGVFGTVGGAAAGSVVTALSAEIYQRSLDRTTQRLRPRGDGTARRQQAPQAQQQLARTTHGPSLPRLILGALVIFVLGICVVSGIERVTGAPLSGGTEGTTSLGQILPVNQVPVVGGLFGSRQPDDSGTDQRTRSPGLVGGLISQLG